MAQWLRIRLPMQGTQVRSLAREDPTCHGAAKPVCHNYWACTLEPASHNYWSLRALEPMRCNCWACVLQLLKPTCLELVLRDKSHRNEKPTHCSKEWPPLAATRESLCAAMKTRHSQKIFKNNLLPWIWQLILRCDTKAWAIKENR